MEEEEEEQPAPAPQVIIYEELVDDPSAYEIGAVTLKTTVEEKKKIFSVANYPQIDITDLLPGDAPDEDFSRAKPTNQVAMNSFLTYVEPYFRPFTEEDLAFLRERVSLHILPTVIFILINCRATDSTRMLYLLWASHTPKYGQRKTGM